MAGELDKKPIVIDVSASDDEEMADVKEEEPSQSQEMQSPVHAKASQGDNRRSEEAVIVIDSDEEDDDQDEDGDDSIDRAVESDKRRQRQRDTLRQFMQARQSRSRPTKQPERPAQIVKQAEEEVIADSASTTASPSSSTSTSTPRDGSPAEGSGSVAREEQEDGRDALTPRARTKVRGGSVPKPGTGSMSSSSFASYEIKALSKSRVEATRLPDIVQYDQRRNIKYEGQANLFLAYIRDSELSNASLSITNLDYIEKGDLDAYQPCPPMDFAFTDDYILTDSVGKSNDTSAGCDCDDDECDPATCSCYRLHETNCTIPWRKEYETRIDAETGEETDILVESRVKGDFAYGEDGRLRPEIVVYPTTPIWECNARCGCTGDCRNRVVGKGRKVPLDLYKTPSGKGWGVRTHRALPRGTFVTVYAGELIDEAESERRGAQYEKVNTSYVFDIDFAHIREKYDVEPYRRHLESQGLPVPQDYDRLLEEATDWNKEPDAVFSVDAGLWGNLSRFFNHCCDPNMTVFSVYTQDRDLRRPFMAFFTNRYVEAQEELTFDYNSGSKVSSHAAASVLDNTETVAKVEEKLDNAAAGQEVKVQQGLMAMKCNCGAINCRGSVFR